jgi:preprotein translocase subunit SecA
MGHVPDGVFNFVGSTIEILSAPKRTVEELTRLAAILREARDERQTPEQVKARIEKEVPALAKLGELLPKNRGELYGFLAVILAAIPLFMQPPAPSQQSPVTVTINQVINQAAGQPMTEPVTEPQQSNRKVGRNEKCPCGSGKKYKKCCGALK